MKTYKYKKKKKYIKPSKIIKYFNKWGRKGWRVFAVKVNGAAFKGKYLYRILMEKEIKSTNDEKTFLQLYLKLPAFHTFKTEDRTIEMRPYFEGNGSSINFGYTDGTLKILLYERCNNIEELYDYVIALIPLFYNESSHLNRTYYKHYSMDNYLTFDIKKGLSIYP